MASEDPSSGISTCFTELSSTDVGATNGKGLHVCYSFIGFPVSYLQNNLNSKEQFKYVVLRRVTVGVSIYISTHIPI